MTVLLTNLAPSATHLLWLAGLVVVVIAYMMLGGAVAGRARLPEADLICGWAVAVSAVTLIGITTRIGASRVDYVLIAVAVAAAIVLWRRERRLFHPGWARAVVLALPMILLVAAMQPSQWDEFTNWLPSARYLFEFDEFPYRDGPQSASVFPAYPYGLATPIVHVSVLVGHFAENTGALFNVALLMAFALLIIRLISLGTGREVDDRRMPGWGITALALLAVTVLSPTFVPKIAFTAYADLATSICVGFAGLIFVFMLGALGDSAAERARALAWQAGLVLTMLLSLKQVNLVLALALVGGAALAAWRDPRVGLRRLAVFAPHILLLPAIVYAGWRIYVAIEIPGGELSVRPISTWFIGLIPKILTQMVYVLSKKGGYFALMLIAIVLGIRALRNVVTPLDRLAVIAATAFVGYNGFLFVCYVTVFGENDAVTVGSFWRYNMHLGALALALAALGLAILWRRWKRNDTMLRPIGLVVIALALAWPVAASSKLRFDIRPPKLYVRGVAQDMGAMLKASDTLGVIDASGYGTYAMIVRYELLGRPANVALFERPISVREDEIRHFLNSRKPDYVWVHVPTPAIETTLGVNLAAGASYLLAREGTIWREKKSWPYPGYTLPVDSD